ncbi:hypothetical protein HMPREF9441_03240 [Paraprevotella clara YIT 11840]|uniref:Uncharacterized protein n=1 Tax=Paraprevotella clara YIT 11840 TaxID=762968 RepID=G5SV25_9BACT|nr:hypothetical protein HMPREF9441_03240 [Paraprevotella clara YIT 11840]
MPESNRLLYRMAISFHVDERPRGILVLSGLVVFEFIFQKPP